MAQKALVVDDNFYNRDLFRLALENVGFEVDEVDDGRKALNYLQGKSCDLLILDLAMPELDGVGVLEAIRNLSTRSQMNVVVITAYAHMAGGIIDEEADFVLYKPIDIQEFAALLRRLQSARA